MKPTTFFRIWFTQRTGSTLLCKSLERTGIAGKAGEYFNKIGFDTLAAQHGATTYEELQANLHKVGSSENGVFGIKHSYTTTHFHSLFEELKELRGIPEEEDMEKVFGHLIPGAKHIFLTRRNKIRQAVSWWQAIQDNVWHVEAGTTHQNEKSFYEDKYIYNALLTLYNQIVLKECATQAYFNKYKIVPYTVVYEDFVAEPERILKDILRYLELPLEEAKFPPFYYAPTANPNSEIWVQRFREEIQKDKDLVW
ncbi:MAG: Stf0 family sulfotransferase [Bacteroidota bacterium]